MRSGPSETRHSFVHLYGKIVDASGVVPRKGPSGVIGTLDEQRGKQLLAGIGVAGFEIKLCRCGEHVGPLYGHRS